MPEFSTNVDERFHSEMEQRLPYLQAYCRKLTGTSWDADDLLQETLMKFYTSLCKNEARQITTSYLCRIAKNTWIDWCRKRKAVDVPLDEGLLVPTEPGTNSEDVQEALEVLAEQLPVRQAVVLLLMDVFHFTAKETAKRIYATEGAVQAALHRARAKLQFISTQTTANKIKHTSSRESASIGDLLKVFLGAFQAGDPEKIFTAYNLLNLTGISFTRMERDGSSLYLYFRDPDGHVLMVTSY
ncbi:RNA polymerase sigma factor [Paenibacillus psychroresistens]|uniref:RNA polymerase sigma factor n=1 Tax=Paenibacillus psychroresistens TaxID=1778678 RepID=A0A6B8RV23_9BACL|nr:RNA polymerase sigma factor [Paenibacillus psychroresistens]QGQ98998.1 RNA polymerase sigma factor [Paenibacillus psychroresistens]